MTVTNINHLRICLIGLQQVHESSSIEVSSAIHPSSNQPSKPQEQQPVTLHTLYNHRHPHHHSVLMSESIVDTVIMKWWLDVWHGLLKVECFDFYLFIHGQEFLLDYTEHNSLGGPLSQIMNNWWMRQIYLVGLDWRRAFLWPSIHRHRPATPPPPPDRRGLKNQ